MPSFSVPIFGKTPKSPPSTIDPRSRDKAEYPQDYNAHSWITGLRYASPE